MRKHSPSVHTRSSHDYKPCPACGQQVRTVHTWCGYCGQQLQIRCPRCQVWTLFGYQVCPECGVALHAAYHGLTTEQELQLAALQHQLQATKAEQTLCQEHLSELSAQRRRAYLRVALVLGSLLLLGGCVVNLFQGLTSTFVGVVVLIALTWLFRFALPGMVRALWNACRRALPEIEPLRQAIAEEERSLRDLEQSACEIQAHIAALHAVDSSPLLEPVEERASEEDEALDEEVEGAESDAPADAEEAEPNLPGDEDLDDPSDPEALPETFVRARLRAWAARGMHVLHAVRRLGQRLNKALGLSRQSPEPPLSDPGEKDQNAEEEVGEDRIVFEDDPIE